MPRINPEVQAIIDRAFDGVAATQEECVQLLKLDPHSPEACALRGAADGLVRSRTGNAAVLFAQIGVSCHPCPANCSFCSFAQDYTQMQAFTMSDEDIVAATKSFTQDGDLFGLWIMAMADYDVDEYCRVIRLVREAAPAQTNIYSNVGDSSLEDFLKMKEAGITGVYHICRLGEGKVTRLQPEDRKQTIQNAIDAGLVVLNAVEPIGPEHTAEELAEQIMVMKAQNPIQTGVMKRINVPGTPFEGTGEINHYRLSQIAAVQCLALADMETLPWIGHHEPCEACYVSGTNMITAETGVNPRDTAEDTSTARGMDLTDCRRMLFEAGFTKLAKGDGTLVDLDEAYIQAHIH
ncbi:MAG: hypothetical protein Q4D06_04805 [Coriobacteriia bacterium]|nr:hypothetical protein [Coriobacteriia bacterium]